MKVFGKVSIFFGLLLLAACAEQNNLSRHAVMPSNENNILHELWKSAESGLPDAQLNLGKAFDQGEGVPLDHAMAEIWYERAALNGNEEAKGLLGNAHILKCSDGQRFIVSFDNGGETGLLLIDGHRNPQILKNNRIASGIELQSDNGDYVFIEHLGRVVLSSLGKSANCREVEK